MRQKQRKEQKADSGKRAAHPAEKPALAPLLDEAALDKINSVRRRYAEDTKYRKYLLERLNYLFFSILKIKRVLLKVKKDDVRYDFMSKPLPRHCRKFHALCMVLEKDPEVIFYGALERAIRSISQGNFSLGGLETFSSSDIPLLRSMLAERPIRFSSLSGRNVEKVLAEIDQDYTTEVAPASIRIDACDVEIGRPFLLTKRMFSMGEANVFVQTISGLREFEIEIRSKAPLDLSSFTEEIDYGFDMTFWFQRTLFGREALYLHTPNSAVFRHHYPSSAERAKEIISEGTFSESWLNKLKSMAGEETMGRLLGITGPLRSKSRVRTALAVYQFIVEHSNGERIDDYRDMDLPYLLSRFSETGMFPGTCKSHAVIAVGMLAACDIPARIASGYMHAWAEIMVEHSGKQYWIPFDTTTGVPFEFAQHSANLYQLNDTIPESAAGSTITFRSLL